MTFFYQIKNKKKERKMLRLQYFSQQIISGRLLLTVIGRKKSNFSGEFKLEPVTT